jgi:hypothetical protein
MFHFILWHVLYFIVVDLGLVPSDSRSQEVITFVFIAIPKSLAHIKALALVLISQLLDIPSSTNFMKACPVMNYFIVET